MMLFCLLTTSFIFSPVIAEEQTNTHIYFSQSNQTPPEKSLVTEIKQTSPFRADASPSTADYGSYVGKYVSIWIRQTTSGGAPISGVTVLFQRSEDGVTWCTYHTGVTGSDGYAYYDLTETCPGVVSYRGADVHGQGATNTFSIEWLQTNPPATCVPIPKCVQKTFSITQVGNPGIYTFDISSECENDGNAVFSQLSRQGWTQIFRKREYEVTKEDFGINGNGLNDATFAYHCGHGDLNFISGNSFLNLKDLNFLYASEVKKKWGKNNKWVMLGSCDILADNTWGNALDTSHGIFGFSTLEPAKDDGAINSFLEYSTLQNNNNQYTLVQAYRKATVENIDTVLFVIPVKGKVIFSTNEQFATDHLPGYGKIAPDKSPDDHSPVATDEWVC